MLKVMWTDEIWNEDVSEYIGEERDRILIHFFYKFVRQELLVNHIQNGEWKGVKTVVKNHAL